MHPMTTWFSDPNLFGSLYGGIGGSVLGIYGGILGCVGSRMAPRGEGRSFILGMLYGAIVFGALNLCAGIVARIMGQPYAIWYPLVLLGAISSLAGGCVMPGVRAAYRQADERRLQAEALRRG